MTPTRASSCALLVWMAGLAIGDDGDRCTGDRRLAVAVLGDEGAARFLDELRQRRDRLGGGSCRVGPDVIALADRQYRRTVTVQDFPVLARGPGGAQSCRGV